jgi:DNA-binding NarL/FixJ family response regulator
MIRVLSVDDHPLLREGIAALANAESDMKLVAEWDRLQDGAKSPVTRDRVDRAILTSTAP